MKYEDLKILDELKEKGSITEEEYQREKAKIMNDNENAFSETAKKPLFGMAENTYLMLMHLSQFAGYLLPGLGFLTPIILRITNKDTNANVDKHGKNIANFLISYLIYAIASGILILILIGIPLLFAIGIMQFIFIIMATVKANNGEYWKYPLTIEFIK